jgi:hypothetical protein
MRKNSKTIIVHFLVNIRLFPGELQGTEKLAAKLRGEDTDS